MNINHDTTQDYDSIPDADRFDDDGSFTDDWLTIINHQSQLQQNPNDRTCNCGSGQSWVSCSVNSQYCG